MKRFILNVVLIGAFFSIFLGTAFAAEPTELSAQAHVQYDGWLSPVGNNSVVGTVGESKNLEAIELKLPEGLNGIRYAAHVADIGWQDWVTNGTIAGTVGESKPIQAIKIELTDEAAINYNIYYRVHCAYIGWLDWTANGAVAGTTGLGVPAQAIEIRVVPKDEPFTEATAQASIENVNENIRQLLYNAHCSNIGWQNPITNGISGTINENRPIEAITIEANDLAGLRSDCGITYQTHVENIGWTDYVSNGQISGTTGQGLAVQAFRVNLTGLAAAIYDVYYTAYVENLGWLDWAMDGEVAGTEGLDLNLEAYEIVLVPKGSNPFDNVALPSINRDILAQKGNIRIQASVENIGWTEPVTAESQVGVTGANLGIEAIAMSNPEIKDSQIIYNLKVEDSDWQGEKLNGEVVGTENENKQAETITIRLAGAAQELYDIYYQAHSEDYGWLGWAKNGEWAGTDGGNKKLEALNVRLVPKGDPAPGPTDDSFIQVKSSGNLTKDDVFQFDLICAIVQHEGGSSYQGALAVMSCVMNRCDSGRWGGTDPVSVLTAPGQFSSYLGGYYRQFLGRSSLEVQQAVLDCLNGTRSHPYQSFRSYPTSGSVNIGGNWFF